LFIVDSKTVIDAGVQGNAARFINHSCDGNCESVIESRRVFIETTRQIEKGEELGYDYEIGREKDDPLNVDEIYACRCGSPKCRGTMLWPAEDPRKKKKRRKAAKKSAAKRR
jgi:SET domain-containing protein